MYTANANISEWYNACSAGGALAYPYGNTYEPEACDGRDYAEAGTPAKTGLSVVVEYAAIVC